MRRLVLLLLVTAGLVASCGTIRRPPNDEISIRATEPPPPEPSGSKPPAQPSPGQCPASQPVR